MKKIDKRRYVKLDEVDVNHNVLIKSTLIAGVITILLLIVVILGIYFIITAL